MTAFDDVKALISALQESAGTKFSEDEPLLSPFNLTDDQYV